MGSLLDGFHTHSGATMYPHPVFCMMAWWVPLLFGSAGVAVGESHVLLDRALKVAYPTISRGRLALGFAGFVLAYFLSGYLPASNLVRTVVLLAIAAGLWCLLDRKLHGILLALGTALGGFVVEVVLSRGGYFAHLRPDFMGIPMWLPALYMSASFSIGQVGRALHGSTVERGS